MSNRQLKIEIRTEIKKGFGDLAKQLGQLSKQLEGISKLSSSIDKLSGAFDKVGRGATVAATSTGNLNKQVSAGVKLVNQYASAQDKAAAKAQQINAAVKAGNVSKQAAIKAEINLLNEVIKKTGDLSVLQSRRDSKGKFGYGGFSADSVKAVKASLDAQSAEIKAGGTRIVNDINAQNAKIKAAMAKMYSGAAFGPFKAGVSQKPSSKPFGPYIPKQLMDNYYPPAPKAAKPGYYSRGNFTSGRPLSGGGGSNFGGGGNSGGNGFGPTQANVNIAEKLYNSYSKLGHALFILKYSTLSIFGASGIGMIAKQADEFITLRNQIARTSDSIDDLGANMKAVFSIANRTFTDAKSVGSLFSTINKYSGNLGINKEQVAGVTEAISGAYAASPGTADAKKAAQYQLVQAITSNRLGGEELRSQLEQAPVVAEILGKGVAKLRGQEGKTIDLRDRENPVRTSELIKVFSMPEVQAELKRLLQGQARTFGDVMTLASNKMTEYVASVETSTGIFGNLTKMMTGFLLNDVKFNSFVKALEAATVAALTFAAIQGARVIPGMVGGMLSGAGKTGFGMSVGASNAMYRAAQFENGMRNVGTGIKSGVNSIGPAFNTARNSAAGAAAAFSIAPFQTLKTAIGSLIGNVVKFAGRLVSLGGVVTLIVVGIALLAARFNHLLGKFGDGITIFNIIGGLWDMLTSKLQTFGTYMDGIFGGLFSNIAGFFDGILKHIIGAAKASEAIRGNQLKEQYGAAGYKADPSGRGGTVKVRMDGKLVTAKIATDVAGNVIKSGNNSLQLLDPTTGKVLRDSKGKAQVMLDRRRGANLPSGVKADLPTPNAPSGPNGKSEAQRQADKWREFLQDTTGTLTENKFMLGITPNMRDVEQAVKDVQKKAADVVNLFSFDELRQKFPEKAAEVDKLTAELRSAKLAEKTQEFIDALTSELASGFQAAMASGMNSTDASKYNNKNNLLKKFLNDSVYFTDEIERKRINKASASTGYDKNEDSILSGMTQEGRDAYNSTLKNTNQNDYISVSGSLDKENKNAQFAFDLQTKILGIYGRKKELAESINEVELKYFDLGPEYLAQKQAELDLIQKQYDLQSRLRGSALEGARAAVSEYQESITDVAGNVQELLGNAFKGLEDVFVNFIQTGKFEWGDFMRSMLADLTRMFVKIQIMEPLMRGLSAGMSGGGGGFLSTALKIGASIFGIGGGAASGVMDAASYTALTAGGVFHNGGIAGSNGPTRSVHPSIFNNAKRYHTGGIAGLMPNEVPAILQRGERITSLAEMARGGGGGNTTFAPAISINYHAAASNGSNGQTMSPEENAKMISQMVEGVIQKQLIEYKMKEKIPGTSAYLANRM